MKEKKMYLSDNDKKLCGVCGGIADYFSIDPTIVRLATIGLMLITAIIPVCIAYAAAAVIIPRKDEK